MPRLALISDTHLPERLAALPEAIFDVLGGCDLVLHAGDVGAMATLDRLSSIAPVVAVRGNDGGAESAAVLPLEQTVVVGGTRILVFHGHFEDRGDEVAWRRSADWTGIFDRLAFRARARGAPILVTGHTHIPWAFEHRGVLLVNPGAVASGNAFLVQTLRSVAVLELAADAPPRVRHVDLDTGEPFGLPFGHDETFDAVAARVQRSILAPELAPLLRDLHRIYRYDPAFREAWLERAHRVWRGDAEAVTAEDARAAFAAGGDQARPLLEKLPVGAGDARGA